ncbi:MAG: pyrroline-5-carboxylate reductase [Gammaproteobacteria bacterium]|nr:pyrroline-5-carboxylate reductase [Gammaproteobacteria bacterium]
MTLQNIAFIGGGNMAGSLIGGLIADGYAADSVWVSDPDAEKLGALRERFFVHTAQSNQEAAQHGAVWLLAVKPQMMRQVAAELAPQALQTRPLVISIAAGIRSADLERWLGGGQAIVRAMPNTPALVRSGASALYANALASEAQKSVAENILRAVGVAVWLKDETLMDAVTALSGSGPAYFFLVMEALEEAGVKLGLTRDIARLLTLETAFGAAKIALESNESSAGLRARVTSTGGTTEQAIKVLEQGRLRELFEAALKAAQARSVELAGELGSNT